MADDGSYASGSWSVKAGSEEEFVARWRKFLEWTSANAAGFQEAFLIRDTEDQRHFVSFARWQDDDAQLAWRSKPEWAEMHGACRELCEDFQGGMFTRVESV